ncbi:MAG: hypothetical protein NZ580_06425 [Bacteroidia bacterium]|nr:hypothetical protein [Bacteroidia bacterium]MDW8235419.1 hypothetical protein [Bacteroidia bacterium]
MFHRGVGAILASVQSLLSLKAQIWDTLLTLPGCESFAQSGGHLWVFAYDRRASMQDSSIGGYLFYFHGEESIPFLKEVTPEGQTWHPFGLAYQAPYLWFLHGYPRPTQVWRYTWTGEKLIQPSIWSHSDFTSLQSVLPIDSVSFYVANDRKGAAYWHLVVGFFIRKVRSSIFFCRDGDCWKVADRIPYAAGMTYLPSERQVWVSVAFRRAIWVYQEEMKDKPRLTWIRRIRLPGYPDNLYTLSDSVVWVLCHKRMNAWARALAFGKGRSRWSIVEVRLSSTGNYTTRTVYQATSGQYATASGALPVGSFIYVGSLFEPYLLRLRVAEASPSAAHSSSTSAPLEAKPDSE